MFRLIILIILGSFFSAESKKFFIKLGIFGGYNSTSANINDPIILNSLSYNKAIVYRYRKPLSKGFQYVYTKNDKACGALIDKAQEADKKKAADKFIIVERPTDKQIETLKNMRIDSSNNFLLSGTNLQSLDIDRKSDEEYIPAAYDVDSNYKNDNEIVGEGWLAGLSLSFEQKINLFFYGFEIAGMYISSDIWLETEIDESKKCLVKDYMNLWKEGASWLATADQKMTVATLKAKPKQLKFYLDESFIKKTFFYGCVYAGFYCNDYVSMSFGLGFGYRHAAYKFYSDYADIEENYPPLNSKFGVVFNFKLIFHPTDTFEIYFGFLVCGFVDFGALFSKGSEIAQEIAKQTAPKAPDSSAASAGPVRFKPNLSKAQSKMNYLINFTIGMNFRIN